MLSMKIIVFGASGATGRELVSQAQRQGHSVTAFIRDRSTYTAVSGVQITVGDVRAINSVADAVAGHDAVMVALGPRTIGKSDLLACGSANIVAAMGKQGVRRIIALGAAGAMPGAAKKQGVAGRIFLGVACRRRSQERHERPGENWKKISVEADWISPSYARRALRMAQRPGRTAQTVKRCRPDGSQYPEAISRRSC